MYQAPQYLDDNAARIAEGRPPQQVEVDTLVDFRHIATDQTSLAVSCAQKIAQLCPEMLETYGRGTKADGNLRVHGIAGETQWLGDRLTAALEAQRSGDNDPDVIRRLEEANQLLGEVRRDVKQLRAA